MKSNLIFHQFIEPETSTFTYLIADPSSKEAVIIDPVLEMVERDLKWIKEMGLKLKYILDTHIHADHVTGAGLIRDKIGGLTGVAKSAGVDCADLALEDGQTFSVGSIQIKVLSTPGHTDTCLSFLIGDMVFTGDSLMIRAAGRTDFQQGDAGRLYESVHNKLFVLPDDTKVFPAHDYKGQLHSTIGLEKKFNPRLGGGKTKAEFVKLMSDLKLENPKKIHVAVPANLSCGRSTKVETH